MKLKRLWDTTERKIAWVNNEAGKPCQVWVDETWENFYYYDKGQWVELSDETLNTYWPTWEELPESDDIGYYDTNEPTNFGTPEDGFTAEYEFVDYDDTVLKSGEVKDGETPVAPEDPTREWYTFKGWKPKVKAISKDTTFKAQYEQIVYTVWLSPANYVWDENEGDEGDYVLAESQDPLWGTFSPATISVPEGAVISVDQTAGEGEHTVDFMVDGETVATITVEVDADAAGEGYEIEFDLGDLSDVTWVGDDGEGNYEITGAATLPVMFMASEIS